MYNNLEILKNLKENNWRSDSHIQRKFLVKTIEEFKYLLENYVENFVFDVNYKSYEYSVYKNEEITIRNNDVFEFDSELLNDNITLHYHLKTNSINEIMSFIEESSLNESKRRVRLSTLELTNLTDNQFEEEIKDLINNGLLKCLYGNGNCLDCSTFIYLAQNENKITSRLSCEYDIKLNIVEQFGWIIDGESITVANVWGNEIDMSYDTIIGLVSDDMFRYIPEEKQLEIFNSDKPSDKIREILNEIGRDQMKIQIDSLLLEIKKAEFK